MKMIGKVILLILTIIPMIAVEIEASDIKGNEKSVEVVDFDELESFLCPKAGEKITYVVNFFATWCIPCVRELPYFLELEKEYAEKGMKFILVSLDFPRHLESRLIPFLLRNEVTSEVYLLDDTRQNYWIPKVSENWSGSIPATIVCNGTERQFFEREFHSLDEIKEVVDPLMK